MYSGMVRLPMCEEEIWLGPPHPSEASYAHAKRAMLAQMESYHDQYGMAYAFCVSTDLFGKHDSFDEASGHVLPSLILKFHHAAREDTAVTVWGTGAPQRDFLYVKDTVRDAASSPSASLGRSISPPARRIPSAMLPS